MAEFAIGGALTLKCNLVFAASICHPTGPDYPPRDLYGANRVVASGVIEPVTSDDQV
jgi:hypothetical protein